MTCCGRGMLPIGSVGITISKPRKDLDARQALPLLTSDRFEFTGGGSEIHAGAADPKHPSRTAGTRHFLRRMRLPQYSVTTARAPPRGQCVLVSQPQRFHSESAWQPASLLQANIRSVPGAFRYGSRSKSGFRPASLHAYKTDR
jgi:hypothetical protein